MSVECTISELSAIYKGDTSPILQPRPTVLADATVLDADWHCYIAANYKDGTEAVASREVTDKTSDDLRWIAALTPTETDTIVFPGGLKTIDIILVIEVINTTTIPPFNKETHYTLPVCTQGIT